MPRISAATSGYTVSCPWPELPETVKSSALPDEPKRISASSFGLPPAPAGSTNTAQPIPRSFPRAFASARRASKPFHSDFASTMSTWPCGSPLSYFDIGSGVWYGNSSLRSRLRRRSSIRSTPVSRAASSTRRSAMYETFGRPAPR